MFKVLRIRLYVLRFFRGIDIALTLLGFFMINWMSRHRFLRAFVSGKYKRDGSVISMPERLRLIIEALGPTFVKFGQILADRPDIVSEKLRCELKKLQTMAEPINHEVAMNLIEAELGGPLKNHFAEINREACIGSASIGQVYKGRLLTGEEVVIKIQRPDIEGKIELDLQLLKYFATQMVKEYPGLTAVDIVGFVEEFGDALTSEMNYTIEAANAIRFGEMFKDVEYCKIPRVYLSLSTSKLLILEYVHGDSTNDVANLTARGYDNQQIALNGIHILLRMIFKHGFFHADPHPGNLFIQENNRLALIDFGMVGVLKPSQMQFLAGFTLGLATQNARIITESLLTLSSKKFFNEKDDLEFYVNEMLSRHGSMGYEKQDFSMILNESIKLILKYDLHIPASIYLLLKAIATIENFGARLSPKIYLPDVIKPYAQEMIMQRFSPSAIGHEIYDTLHDYLALIKDFPGEMNEILFKLKQGKLIHEIHLSDQDVWGKSAKNIGGIIATVLLLGFMMTAAIVMGATGKSPVLANILFGVSAVFSVWVLFKLLLKVRF